MKKTKSKPLVVKKQSNNEFLTKALAAQKSGMLTALEVSVAEHSLMVGRPVPERIRDIVNGYF